MEQIYKNDLGEIKDLNIVNNELYFTATLTGKNAIYKMNLDDNSVQQIYEPRFGAECADISPDGSKMAMSDYTSDGFRIVEFDLNKIEPVPISRIERKNYPLADSLAKQEQGVIDFESIEYKEYPTAKYSKLANLIHFHSWAPVAVDPDNYTFNPGLSLLSQNLLGSADINLGYRWKTDERTGETYFKYSYKGWYPVFDIEFSSGKSASKYMLIEQTANQAGKIIKQDTTIRRFTWKESNLGIDARVPLNLSSGKYNRYFQPEVKFNYIFYGHNSSTPESFFEGNFKSISYRLYYQQLLTKSYQDVFPNFGFYGDIIYQQSPFGDADFGDLSLIQGSLFLPGLMPNHGIKIYSGLQYKNSESPNSFSERIRYPRGWGKFNTTEAFSAGVDYKLPLFYPEWNVGSFVYLKRLSASVFTDFAKLKGNLYTNNQLTGTFKTNISSYGIELTGDANFLRFYAPVEIGTRATFMPQKNSLYFEFLLFIDFNTL